MKYDSLYLPVLLRQARLARDWSQESVANGICAVSYLSKIENGKIVPAPDIVEALAKRLGLTLEDASLTAIEAKLDAFYASHYEQEDGAPVFEAEELERMLGSVFALDAMLIRCQNREAVETLRSYEPFFDARQRRKYDELRLLQGAWSEEAFLATYHDFFAYAFAAETSCRHERMLDCLAYWSEALSIAQKEMDVERILDALLGRLVAFSILSDIPSMERVFAQIEKVATMTATDSARQMLDNARYNVGASRLERREYAKALELLLGCAHRPLAAHKIALCYEGLGEYELAKAWIVKEQQRASSVFFDVVRYRLEHPNYLREEAYARMMKRCLDEASENYHYGYFLFHLPYYLDVLEANRQYKEAYGLLKRHFIKQWD
ncbi:helix-turn-helix transcriptional regulator [uncultured Dubosiella sp.]|uniref:helix-turn-helix domain-containing protein n=1 Tax=uncultured Dubosiella sp. TaxID=1937011 RepID=UPI00259AF2DB|nr:helix-turn-helix transcriptional regulator [uncultured Dubosiella sp.]